MDQQVAPAELEEVLLRHEAVQEAVVVGVPHGEFGEAARAYLLLAQGRQDSATIEVQLRQLLAGQLAYHKQLHGGVEFLASIPQTATGKNLRRLLRDSYVQSRAHEGTT
ncbi:hypothetical protein V5799_015565 [Amblyomma americanum]|uniref:AMP-binding enzyme C-terminal domain-containing protein n=1 Tax=Amblyomma americanum TaxID=6943 RepID=A0AAQ4F8M5_AMBAM